MPFYKLNMIFTLVAVEIARLQTELSSTKSEKDAISKSHDKLQQKAGQQVWWCVTVIHCIFTDS